MIWRSQHSNQCFVSDIMQATEQQKVESLRALLSLVVTNTKKEMGGKPSNGAKEQKAVETHLSVLLGRKPLATELQAARRYS